MDPAVTGCRSRRPGASLPATFAAPPLLQMHPHPTLRQKTPRLGHTAKCSHPGPGAHLVQNVRIGDLIPQPPRHPHVRLRGVKPGVGGCPHDLGPQGPQDVHLQGDAVAFIYSPGLPCGGWVPRRAPAPPAYLLHAHLLWHHDDAAVALHGGSQGQSDPWGQHMGLGGPWHPQTLPKYLQPVPQAGRLL